VKRSMRAFQWTVRTMRKSNNGDFHC